MDSAKNDIESFERKVLISRDQIKQRVKELGEQLSKDYQGTIPVFVGVLNGCFLFIADLVRELSIDCEVDFLKISSYGNARKSSGKVRIRKRVDCHLEGRDVVVVEDIIDSGISVDFLRKWLIDQNPKSLKFVSLLVKDGAAVVDYSCEYVGFHIPNEFVIGYGLDYAQLQRNLPDVYVMETPNDET